MCVYMCVHVVRTSKIYSYNNFHVYNTVLLTVVIILYIRSPQLIQLITGILYYLTNMTSLAPPQLSLFHFYFREFGFLKIPHISEIIQYLSLSNFFYLA